MKQKQAGLTEKEISILILLAAFIFGTWIRLLPASTSEFPINDGGMFYSMIRDLRLNGYILPQVTTYNNLNIPFAYPPFAFYLAGFISDLTNFSDIQILIWLPALINILTLPAFFLLSKTILKNDSQSAIATFFYSLTPLSVDWFLMGGGLTRGLGQLLLILTSLFTIILFQKHSIQHLIFTILCASLVVLTHPESAILTVTSGIIIWIFSARSKQTIIDVVIICSSVTLLCFPWLYSVISFHSVSPFLNALQTNGNSLFLWRSLFTFDFAQESGLAIVSILGLIGIFSSQNKNKKFLVFWLAIPFYINPRSAARLAIIPLAILATCSVYEVILPSIKKLTKNNQQKVDYYQIIFSAYLAIYIIINAYSLDLRIMSNTLGKNDRTAMNWVSLNTPIQSTFIIITGEPQMMRDPVQEWFPALTGRTSLTTMQGKEWVWGNKFLKSLINYQGLSQCYWQDAKCVSKQISLLGISFDYLYLSKEPSSLCNLNSSCSATNYLYLQLLSSTDYSISYDDNSTAIFKHLQ